MCLNQWKQTIIPVPQFLYIHTFFDPLLAGKVRILSSSIPHHPQMGREGNDSLAIHSSIALLQERFRQLQRVKEMREERELLMKSHGDHGRLSPAIHCQSSRLSSHAELGFATPPPPPEITLSLWPSRQIKHSNFNGDGGPSPQRRKDGQFMRGSVNKFHEPEFCDSDVDTSLHL